MQLTTTASQRAIHSFQTKLLHPIVNDPSTYRYYARHRHVVHSLPQVHLQKPSVPDSTTHNKDREKDSCDAFKSSSHSDTAVQQHHAERASGILQLGQLTSPAKLSTTWQQQIMPDCCSAWSTLRHDILHTIQQLTAEQHYMPQVQQQDQLNQQPQKEKEQLRQLTNNQQQHVDCQWSEPYLYKLDGLLGTLQQVLLLCSLIKDQHANQDWRTAAAAVFVEARNLEQEVCSDLLLQQGILLAQQHLQQQQKLTNQPVYYSNSLILAKTLRKHMQLEGLSPLGFAGLKPSATGFESSPETQVLSAEDQQTLLSGLLVEQKVLVSKMQDVLLNPELAPVVELDAESRQILLQPLTVLQAEPPPLPPGTDALDSAAARAAARAAAAAAAAPTVEGNVRQQILSATAAMPAPDETEAGDSDVVLDLPLVWQLLQRHPDPAVRADVYAAGLLQQLDRLLQLWGDLAEVRRKVARLQGSRSYADWVLQHSLLGSAEAAAACCEQLAAALGPAAKQTAQQLQQLQQQACCDSSKQPDSLPVVQGAPPTALQGSDVEYLLHQSRVNNLSQQDLLQLQPYLQLSKVLSGFGQLLQLSLGLALRPRAAAAGETWNDGVQVLELYDVSHSFQKKPQLQQEQEQNNHSTTAVQPKAGNQSVSNSTSYQQQHAGLEQLCSPAGDRLLGTIYLDPSGGFATQLLLYGSHYNMLGGQQLWQQQQQQQGLHSGGSTNSRSGKDDNLPTYSSASCPAVAVGLQSQGLLGGTHTQLAFGLWELCHELGHAVNFILSASAIDNSSSSSANEQVFTLRSPSEPPSASVGEQGSQQQLSAADKSLNPNELLNSQARCSFHMHAAWHPVEVLELPSILFEGFSMDPICLQLLCCHHETRQQLPCDLAVRLASFIQDSHYNPLVYQRNVLAMLFDLQLLAREGLPLGRHTAHTAWQDAVLSPQLSATPGVEVTLQQVTGVPRLLVSAGQGYGYAVAWCLSQLLQPALVRHVHRAAAAEHRPGSPAAAAAAAGSVPSAKIQQINVQHVQVSELPELRRTRKGSCNTYKETACGDISTFQQLWRQFLSEAAGLGDAAVLVRWILRMQQHDIVATDRQQQAQQEGKSGVGADSCSSPCLRDVLQEQGLWSALLDGSADPLDLMAVCLSTALNEVNSMKL